MNLQYIKTHIRHFLISLCLLGSINAFAIIKIDKTTYDKNTGKGAVVFMINGSAGDFQYQIVDNNGNIVRSSITPIPKDNKDFLSEVDLDKGNYKLLVTNSLQCTFEYPFIIDECLVVTPQAFNSCDEEKGGIKLDVQYIGQETIAYTWKDENGIVISTNKDVSKLAKGKYCYTVQAGECEASDCVEINEFSTTPIVITKSGNPSITLPPAPVNGSVQFTISGGQDPYNWTLTGPSLNETGQNNSISYNNLIGGLYTLNVLDANGCFRTSTLEVISCQDLSKETSFHITKKIIDDCPFEVEFDFPAKGMNGLLIEETKPKEVEIKHPDGNTYQTRDGVTYCYRIKSANLDGTGFCGIFQPNEILGELCFDLECEPYIFEKEYVNCNEWKIFTHSKENSCDPFFLWSNSTENTSEVTALLPQDKTVFVTVSDRNGCQQTEVFNFDISESGQISGGCGEPYCITFNTNGFPNGPFTFEWYLNNEKLSNTDSKLCDLAKGTYKVFIKDEKDCTFEKEFKIEEVTKGIDASYTVTPEDLFMSSKDGAIEVTIKEIVTPYDYYITNYNGFHASETGLSSTVLNFDGLHAGIYYLFLKGDDGCTKRFTIEVFYCKKYIPELELKMIDVTQEQVTNNPQVCKNKVWGASFTIIDKNRAELNIKGGLVPYTYELKSYGGHPKGYGVLTSDNEKVTFDNLGVGSYLLSIKDNQSCYKKYSITIIENPDKGTEVKNDKFWEINGVVTDISAFCTGGAIKLTNAGAFGKNATFEWTKPDKTKVYTKDLENLTEEGTYSVVVSYGYCNKSASKEFVVKKEKDKLMLSKDICNGCIDFNDPELEKWQDLNITYTNLLTNETKITKEKSICDLNGKYTFVFDNLSGCKIIQEIEIIKTGIKIENADVKNTCAGNDGAIKIVATSSDNSSLSYTWSNGMQGSIIENLASNYYGLKITNESGCVLETSYIVYKGGIVFETIPTCDFAPSYILPKPKNEGTNDCIGCTYLWDNNITTKGIQANEPGTYTITVKNEKGCVGTQSFKLFEEPKLILPCSSDNNTQNKGKYILPVNSDYVIKWSDKSSPSTSDRDDLEIGKTYKAIVLVSGCKIERTYTIEPFNAANIKTEVIPCQDKELFLSLSGCVFPVKIYIDNNEKYTWSGFAPSVYSIAHIAKNAVLDIVDARGCKATKNVEFVDEKFEISLSLGTVCDNANAGTIRVESRDPQINAPYTYTAEFNKKVINDNLKPFYFVYPKDKEITVVATNGKGCSSIKKLLVTTNAKAPEFSIATENACDNLNNGTAEVMGWQPDWRVVEKPPFPVQINKITNIPIGNYSITIKSNTNGCYTKKEFSIFGSALKPSIEPVCGDNQDGKIDFKVSQSYSDFYLYDEFGNAFWPNPLIYYNTVFTDLPKGIYSGNYKLKNGCTFNGTIDLTKSSETVNKNGCNNCEQNGISVPIDSKAIEIIDIGGPDDSPNFDNGFVKLTSKEDKITYEVFGGDVIKSGTINKGEVIKITNLKEGRYGIYWKDTKDCNGRKFFNFYPCKISYEYSNEEISSFFSVTLAESNKNNGAIKYVYRSDCLKSISWEGPNGFKSNSFNISNLAPGDYSFIIKSGCCNKPAKGKLTISTKDICDQNKPNISFEEIEPACGFYPGKGKFVNLGSSHQINIVPIELSQSWDTDLFNKDDLDIKAYAGNYTITIKDPNTSCIYTSNFKITKTDGDKTLIENSCNYKIKCGGKEEEVYNGGQGLFLESVNCKKRVLCNDGTERMIDDNGFSSEWVIKNKCSCYAEKICNGVVIDSEFGVKTTLEVGGCYENVECNFFKANLGKKIYDDCAQASTLCSIKSGIYFPGLFAGILLDPKTNENLFPLG